MKAVVVCALLVLAAATVNATGLKLKLDAKHRTRVYQHLLQSRPRTSFADFAKSTGVDPNEDHLSQIREDLDAMEWSDMEETADAADDNSEDLSLVQVGTGVKKVQSFCEICILVMQMKERGQPHLCAGLNDQYYITCVEVLISLLRADKALVYWLKNGCMHMDSTGPEIVRPCPAINICSWIPNLFSQPPSIVRDGVESMCPKDNKFLPTIPQEYKSLIPKDKE